ncbi:hypothetical protein ERC79_06805 [Rhodococcus sp. ABRD24]|nr:hypothetical protein ERC79_06805 [Rhodococcus sp. ABRD24]
MADLPRRRVRFHRRPPRRPLAATGQPRCTECPPHGGFAIGLDRLVSRLLEADNIRCAALFPPRHPPNPALTAPAVRARLARIASGSQSARSVTRDRLVAPRPIGRVLPPARRRPQPTRVRGGPRCPSPGGAVRGR